VQSSPTCLNTRCTLQSKYLRLRTASLLTRVRIHELAQEAEVRNDVPKDPDQLHPGLAFTAPRGSIQHEKGFDPHRDSETAYSETPDDEEPNDHEKQTLRRSMCYLHHRNALLTRPSRRESSHCCLACGYYRAVRALHILRLPRSFPELRPKTT